MSGGAICGYCAIGSARMQTPPISVMRIAMTIATIGRLTKNSDMRSGFLRARRLYRGRGLGRRRPLFHRHGRTLARLLYAFDNDFVSGLQSVSDLPHGADALTRLYRANIHLVVLIDYCDLEITLQFGHRLLWNN